MYSKGLLEIVILFLLSIFLVYLKKLCEFLECAELSRA